MKKLFTQEEFKKAKSKDLLSCECYQCSKSFVMTKHKVQMAINPNATFKGMYCSKECQDQALNTPITTNCKNCNKELVTVKSKLAKSKSGNLFCDKSCSASYNNKNKTKGNRRSKLEIWLEEQLTKLYPTLPIDFNKKSAIGSELDIYIPSLNVAFELNGLFHYEPIFGVDKLNQIQENDKNKFQKCFENKIDLCIIDTSKQIYVKPSTSQKYLDIIMNIINERLN